MLFGGLPSSTVVASKAISFGKHNDKRTYLQVKGLGRVPALQCHLVWPVVSIHDTHAAALPR